MCIRDRSVPVYEGKIFTGWYEDEACTIPFDRAEGERRTMSLYAGWKTETYTLSLIHIQMCIRDSSKVDTVGEGKTYALKGMAVVTAGKIVGFQEGIIDMTGPGADYTPFSKTLNLVMVCEPVDDIDVYKRQSHQRK